MKRNVAFPLALLALLADARVALADVEDPGPDFEFMLEENSDLVALLVFVVVILIALVAFVAISRMRK